MAVLRSIRVYDNVIRSELSRSRSLKATLRPVSARATTLAKEVANERVQRRTGKYLSGFTSTVESAMPPAVARVVTVNTAKQGGILERGSKSHIIRARRAKQLRFVQNGRVRYAKYVFHPGTKPYRIIEVALKRLARGR